MLDIKTLFIVIALANACCSLIILILHKLNLFVSGTLYWAWGTMVGTAAILLMLFRGILPDFLTIVIANIGLIYALTLALCGLRLFNGRNRTSKTALTVPLAWAPFLFWFSEIIPSLSARIVIATSAFCIFSIAIANELIRKKEGRRYQVQVITGIVFILNAAISIGRIFFALIEPPEGAYFSSGFITIGYSLWSIVFVVFYTSGIVLMINEKLNSEIVTLKGILPICSFCKKIRDDRGYWQQVEAYIGLHSKADFSHSICPE